MTYWLAFLEFLFADGVALDGGAEGDLLIVDGAVVLVFNEAVEFGGGLVLEVLGVEEAGGGGAQVGVAGPFLGGGLEFLHRLGQMAALSEQARLAQTQAAFELDAVDHRHRLGGVKVVGHFFDVGDLCLDLFEITDFELVLQHVQLGQKGCDLFLVDARQTLQAGVVFVPQKSFLQLLGGCRDLPLLGLVLENLAAGFRPRAGRSDRRPCCCRAG